MDIASDPPVAVLQSAKGGGSSSTVPSRHTYVKDGATTEVVGDPEKGDTRETELSEEKGRSRWFGESNYAATFLTQLEVLSGREWKILKRSILFSIPYHDPTDHFPNNLEIKHCSWRTSWSPRFWVCSVVCSPVNLAIVSGWSGTDCASGGLYFNTGVTIAGFQSRVGCLFFLVRPTPANPNGFH